MADLYPNEYVRDLATVRQIRATPDASNRAIARAAGVSHPYVAKVRDRIEAGEFDDEPAQTWKSDDLPRTAAQVKALQERDIDDLIVEVARLNDEIDQLRRQQDQPKPRTR